MNRILWLLLSIVVLLTPIIGACDLEKEQCDYGEIEEGEMEEYSKAYLEKVPDVSDLNINKVEKKISEIYDVTLEINNKENITLEKNTLSGNFPSLNLGNLTGYTLKINHDTVSINDSFFNFTVRGGRDLNLENNKPFISLNNHNLAVKGFHNGTINYSETQNISYSTRKNLTLRQNNITCIECILTVREGKQRIYELKGNLSLTNSTSEIYPTKNGRYYNYKDYIFIDNLTHTFHLLDTHEDTDGKYYLQRNNTHPVSQFKVPDTISFSQRTFEGINLSVTKKPDVYHATNITSYESPHVRVETENLTDILTEQREKYTTVQLKSHTETEKILITIPTTYQNTTDNEFYTGPNISFYIGLENGIDTSFNEGILGKISSMERHPEIRFLTGKNMLLSLDGREIARVGNSYNISFKNKMYESPLSSLSYTEKEFKQNIKHIKKELTPYQKYESARDVLQRKKQREQKSMYEDTHSFITKITDREGVRDVIFARLLLDDYNKLDVNQRWDEKEIQNFLSTDSPVDTYLEKGDLQILTNYLKSSYASGKENFEEALGLTKMQLEGITMLAEWYDLNNKVLEKTSRSERSDEAALLEVESDKTSISQKYRNEQIDSYKEKYDHLPKYNINALRGQLHLEDIQIDRSIDINPKTITSNKIEIAKVLSEAYIRRDRTGEALAILYSLENDLKKQKNTFRNEDVFSKIRTEIQHARSAASLNALDKIQADIFLSKKSVKTLLKERTEGYIEQLRDDETKNTIGTVLFEGGFGKDLVNIFTDHESIKRKADGLTKKLQSYSTAVYTLKMLKSYGIMGDTIEAWLDNDLSNADISEKMSERSKQIDGKPLSDREKKEVDLLLHKSKENVSSFMRNSEYSKDIGRIIGTKPFYENNYRGPNLGIDRIDLRSKIKEELEFESEALQVLNWVDDVTSPGALGLTALTGYAGWTLTGTAGTRGIGVASVEMLAVDSATGLALVGTELENDPRAEIMAGLAAGVGAGGIYSATRAIKNRLKTVPYSTAQTVSRANSLSTNNDVRTWDDLIQYAKRNNLHKGEIRQRVEMVREGGPLTWLTRDKNLRKLAKQIKQKKNPVKQTSSPNKKRQDWSNKIREEKKNWERVGLRTDISNVKSNRLMLKDRRLAEKMSLDLDNDEFRRFVEEVKTQGKFQNTQKAINTIHDIVYRNIEYDDPWSKKLAASKPVEPIEDCILEGKGVCRHQSLLSAGMLAELDKARYIPPGRARYNAGNVHAWTEFETVDNLYVIDVAQKYAGPIQISRETDITDIKGWRQKKVNTDGKVLYESDGHYYRYANDIYGIGVNSGSVPEDDVLPMRDFVNEKISLWDDISQRLVIG